MARRSEHSREVLEALIFDSANRIVESEGLAELSVRKICKEISYTPGTIYIFFDSVDELILKINAKTLDDIFAELEAVTKIKNSEQAIKKIAKIYLDYSLLHPNRCSALYEYSYTHATHKSLPEWYQAKVDRIFDLIEQVIPDSKDSQVYARLLWTGLHGIVSLAISDKLDVAKAKSAATMVEVFVRVFIKGIN